MKRIAIVEDDPFVRRSLSALLRSEGYDPVTFDDAAPALDSGLTSMDLIITDLNMPMRGEKLIQEVRNSGLTVPILVMSGNFGGVDPGAVQELGAQGSLEKPFSAEELLESIRKLVV